jgi:hypothetical protein
MSLLRGCLNRFEGGQRNAFIRVPRFLKRGMWHVGLADRVDCPRQDRVQRGQLIRHAVGGFRRLHDAGELNSDDVLAWAREREFTDQAAYQLWGSVVPVPRPWLLRS